jgi:hypothetical protein
MLASYGAEYHTLMFLPFLLEFFFRKVMFLHLLCILVVVHVSAPESFHDSKRVPRYEIHTYDKIFERIRDISDRYYKAIGLKSTPPEVSFIIENGSAKTRDKIWSPIIEKVSIQIYQTIERRLNSSRVKPSVVLYAPFHSLLQTLRIASNRIEQFPRLLLGFQTELLLEHKRSASAVGFFYLFNGIADYLELIEQPVDKYEASIIFLEQNLVFMYVGEGLRRRVRKWFNREGEKEYSSDLKAFEDFLIRPIPENPVDRSKAMEVISKYFEFSRRLWSELPLYETPRKLKIKEELADLRRELDEIKIINDEL